MNIGRRAASRYHRKRDRTRSHRCLERKASPARARSRHYSGTPAKNGFEGHHTVSIYNLLAHGKEFEKIPIHPNVLPVIEGVLDKECLISSLSFISIDPGEKAQPIHADDQIMPVAKPHVLFVCNSMWALTDFTEENGATRIIPGTHLADSSPEYGKHYDSIPAEMKKGSVLVWNGSLWHGGGANKSSARHYRNLVGHIDKKTPAQRLLGETRDFKSVWDLADR